MSSNELPVHSLDEARMNRAAWAESNLQRADLPIDPVEEVIASPERSTMLASRAATGLPQPLFARAPPDDTSRLFIVEKTGEIKILDLTSGQVLATPFLDLSGQVDTSGERGLLGLAFDPDFANNGFLYVN